MPFENMAKLSWIYDLYRLGQDSAPREKPAEVQRRILEHIVQGIGADTGSLSVRADVGDELVLTARIGLPPQAIGMQIKKGQGVIGWVLEHAEPVLLTDDPAKDPRFKDYEPCRESTEPGSSICWPLKQENCLIGTLCVNRKAGSPPFTEADMAHGSVLVNMVSIVIENTRLHQEQAARIQSLSDMNKKLAEAQGQLLQSEKMASIGHLAAGVAHEINNPIGFVYSNLGSLEKYIKELFAVLDGYEQAQGDPAKLAEVEALKKKVDMGYLKEDVPALMNESRDGISRVKKIVQNLKDFSHVDTSNELQWTNLHSGIDSTLNIVWNEIKYKAEVNKTYGDIPDIKCLPSELNQVFMNMLVNAAHAIDERGVITIRTGREGDQVWVEIADNGKGIKAEHIKRIFDPFFTTKPVGKGTGLGLSLSYSIVQKHNGHIDVNSEVGKGTAFRVWLPIQQEEIGEARK
ncbi:MAG: ATP-binding protein [Thiobacillus sp.]|nr:ATP-binding protein [Thiobacillus sp.]